MSTENALQQRGLSVVIPAFNEEGNISILYRELLKVLPVLGMPWEILCSIDNVAASTCGANLCRRAGGRLHKLIGSGL